MDRLSAFFDAFPLEVRVAEPAGAAGAAGPGRSTRYLLPSATEAAGELLLVVRGDTVPQGFLVALAVAFGGAGNPLLNALPDTLSLPISDGEPRLRDMVLALRGELADGRCGHRHALQRLGEVLVLFLLRSAIERGTARPCLLAGLAHPQLHPVLVAMHDAPAHAWRVEELAQAAGMSRSRFMAIFGDVVGTTPMSYLTRWRLQLGRRELNLRGASVKSVARRVGFGSAEAFSRAYQREFGRSPVHDLRQMAL